MKRITLKSSHIKITTALSSACVAALFMGNTAFANPDNTSEQTDETNAETILIDETVQSDAVEIPNVAVEGAVEVAPAVSLDAGYEVVQDQDAATTESETLTTETESETLVIESSEAVVISNPDATEDTVDITEDAPE